MKVKSILAKVLVVLIALGFIAYGSITIINAKNSPVDLNEITTSDMSNKAYSTGKTFYICSKMNEKFFIKIVTFCSTLYSI